MRMLLAAAALAAIPLISSPVHAADDFATQAQKFLGTGNGNSDDQERAYERGRRDQDMQNRQAERDRQNDNGYRDRDSRYDSRRDYPNTQYPNNQYPNNR